MLVINLKLRKSFVMDRSATAELAKLRNTEAFWELLVRHKKYLPQFSSKFINGDTLHLIE